MIRITCGATSFLAPLDGKTVAEIRAATKDILGLTDRHAAYPFGAGPNEPTLSSLWIVHKGFHVEFRAPAPVAPGLTATFDLRQGVIVCCQGRVNRFTEYLGPNLGVLYNRYAAELNAPPPGSFEYVLNGQVVVTTATGNTVVPDGSCVEFRPFKKGCCPNGEKGIPCPHRDLDAWKAWRRERGLSEDWPPDAVKYGVDTTDDPEYAEAYLLSAARMVINPPSPQGEGEEDDPEFDDDDDDDEE